MDIVYCVGLVHGPGTKSDLHEVLSKRSGRGQVFESNSVLCAVAIHLPCCGRYTVVRYLNGVASKSSIRVHVVTCSLPDVVDMA